LNNILLQSDDGKPFALGRRASLIFE